MMSKPQIDPAKIFEQAGCFYQAWNVLRAIPRENDHAFVTLIEPLVVLGAFTTELFLKCLVCIETGNAPRDHNLRRLFDHLSMEARTRIQNLWNSATIRRSKKWDELEKFGLSMPRDLPSALDKGSSAFERIRYSYEGKTEGVHFYLEDLPAILERLILEIKPELEAYRRRRPLPFPVLCN
jgi:hypothetical protein